MVLYWENPTNEAFICCLLHFRTEVQSICHYPLGYLLCNSHQVTPNSFFFLDNVRFPFSPENPQFSHKQISNQKGLVNPVPVMGHVIPVCWFGVFCNYSNELVSFSSQQVSLLDISYSLCIFCCLYFCPKWFVPNFILSHIRVVLFHHNFNSDATIEGKGSSPKLQVFSWPNMTIGKYLREMEQVRKKIIKTGRFRSEAEICAENRRERKQWSVCRERTLVVLFFTQFKGIFCRHLLCCTSFLSHYIQLCLSNICSATDWLYLSSFPYIVSVIILWYYLSLFDLRFLSSFPLTLFIFIPQISTKQ